MPVYVNIYDAKTQLSRLVDRAAAGEEIVIARNGRPMAKLTSLRTARTARVLGRYNGLIRIATDFDELPDEIRSAFEGRAE